MALFTYFGRRAVARAYHTTIAFHDNLVTTEHFLLGVLEMPRYHPPLDAALDQAGLDVTQLGAQFRLLVKPPQAPEELPAAILHGQDIAFLVGRHTLSFSTVIGMLSMNTLSPDFRVVLTDAHTFANECVEDSAPVLIGLGHLLLALEQPKMGYAGSFLVANGLTTERLRAMLLQRAYMM